uniref:Protein kinase domain-containing protein n=1 Tax=Anisakis simplex TaxID=6269 RepID=A0A0M3J5P7_ANISI
LLSSGQRYATPCFIGARKVYLVRGKYPDLLTTAWNEFAAERSYYNDCPEVHDEQQHFVIFESADGGVNLDAFKIKIKRFIFISEIKIQRFDQVISVFVQLMLSLAIAERLLCFEHRDLHAGNILIQSVPIKTDIE